MSDSAKRRATFQSGSVVRKQRLRGPDVWVFRFKDGEGKQPALRLGTVDKYPTKAAAQKRAAKLLHEINERVSCITFAGLCDRYLREGLPARLSSAAPYRSLVKRVRAHWGSARVDVMARDIMGIEQWINHLQTLDVPARVSARGEPVLARPARPVSKKTKIHVKALLHRMFECAIKWGHLTMQRNPISLVEIQGRRKRVRLPNILTREQWARLVADPLLAEHVRAMISIAMLLGLRASEILGLRWEDVDLARRVLSIRRSHVGQYVDDTKTEGSEQELPIHEDLARVLIAWRAEQEPVNGWLFGNLRTGRPFWRDSLQTRHLVPAGKRIGIPNLGWHDFRHTYRAMMNELNISLELQRTLMRHEDIRTTLGYGGKTPADVGRPANAKVVEMLRRQA